MNNNQFTHKDILEQIVSISGLYEKIFGKLLDKLVFKQTYENQKNILKTVFNFNDVENIFEKQIERKEFASLSKIIFRFSNPDENGGGFFRAKKDN